MIRQSFFLCVLLCGIFLLCGCTEQSTHRSHTNDLYGFSFNPPLGWHQIENELPNVAVWFAPQNSSYVSLKIAVPFMLSEGRALSTYADEIVEDLSERGVNFSVLNRDWRSIPYRKAYEIAYTYEQDGLVEYVKQVAVLRTRTVFLITFTAPSTLSAQYLEEVDQSIDTFM